MVWSYMGYASNLLNFFYLVTPLADRCGYTVKNNLITNVNYHGRVAKSHYVTMSVIQIKWRFYGKPYICLKFNDWLNKIVTFRHTTVIIYISLSNYFLQCITRNVLIFSNTLFCLDKLFHAIQTIIRRLWCIFLYYTVSKTNQVLAVNWCHFGIF